MEIKTKDDACILNFSSLEETINMYNFITMKNSFIVDNNGIFCEIDITPFSENVTLSVNSIYVDTKSSDIKKIILSYLN